MAVAHSSLTGTDLHEIKGASSATSGQVPVSNGAGGAPFGLLTHTSLTGTGNPFGGQLLHVREQQSSGVSSSSAAASAAWNTQVLNTVITNEISGASLASNTVSLPAGTYYIYGRTASYAFAVGPGFNGVVKARLRNTTASTTPLVGSSSFFNNGGASAIYPPGFPMTVEGRITLTGTTNLQLHCYTVLPYGVPQGAGGSEVEVYAELYIWKIA